VAGDAPAAPQQEGRVGYEQYASLAYALQGFDTYDALQLTDFLRWVEVEGVQVPADRRDPATSGAQSYVLSEPYVLRGLEFAPSATSAELAYRVYRAQAERYRREGILTAVSEDHLDRAPYFVYNTVLANGKPWSTLTDKGDDASAFRTLSTKAAFGWEALYDTDYTRRLVATAGGLNDPGRGWYAGQYEKDGSPDAALTANTNGVILEALHYRRFGPLLRPDPMPAGPQAATALTRR
jgi:hypothetical protein